MVMTTSARAAATLAISTLVPPAAFELLDRGRIDVDAFDLMAGLDQVLRHRQTHIAEADESDARHRASPLASLTVTCLSRGCSCADFKASHR